MAYFYQSCEINNVRVTGNGSRLEQLTAYKCTFQKCTYFNKEKGHF